MGRSAANRRTRLEQILERDEPTCVWCRRDVDVNLVHATTEHVVPKLKGGPSWIENEVAACSRCNSQRGHKNLADWANDCDQLGWEPDRERLITVLESLEARIAVEGGQRKARPYIATQLRRLRGAIG